MLYMPETLFEKQCISMYIKLGGRSPKINVLHATVAQFLSQRSESGESCLSHDARHDHVRDFRNETS
jgi:hypothetical protein